jgi:hypothetical protein
MQNRLQKSEEDLKYEQVCSGVGKARQASKTKRKHAIKPLVEW